MNINVTDSFNRSLRRLGRETQAATKQLLGEIITGGISPVMNLEPLHANNFWSIRVRGGPQVGTGWRIIIHREDNFLTVLHIAEHDPAYRWADQHKYQRNPITNSMQLISIIETDESLISPHPDYQMPKIFDKRQFDDEYLLALGVPEEWLPGVRQASEENHIDDLIENLPEEVMERLLQLRDGKIVPIPRNDYDNPMDNPDTKRHFITVEAIDGLSQALDYPWDEWITFLHPDQESLVHASFEGPVKISGGAGTGKTVLAVHRAVRMAKSNPSEKILLTTFTRALAFKIRTMVSNLCAGEIPSNLDIKNIHLLAHEIWNEHHPNQEFDPLFDADIEQIIEKAMGLRILGLDLPFLISEWKQVIDYWGITDLEAYQIIPRTGRGTILGASQREDLWQIFGPIWKNLQEQPERMTFQQIAFMAAGYETARSPKRYHHAIVDESQDFGPSELTLVRSIVDPGRDDLFLCGDSNQMIYRKPFIWSRVGIDIQGRSRHLSINYRNTKQIQRFAMTVLDHDAVGGDGEADSNDALSPLRGERPLIISCKDEFEEQEQLASWIKDLIRERYEPEEIAVLFRRNNTREAIALPAITSVSGFGITTLIGNEYDEINNDAGDDNVPHSGDLIAVGTMHGSKGLEFRAVAVIGCGENDLPDARAINDCYDDTERAEILAQERNVLFVALTRPRERLLITHTGNLSSLFSSDVYKDGDHFQT